MAVVVTVVVAVSAVLWVLGERVIEILVGVFGDDVPGVDEAGEETEHAEEDVDEGVGGAETCLYPDCLLC